MTATAITMMILICGVVWGGFVTLLLRAVRHEGKKRARQLAGKSAPDGLRTDP